VEEQKWGLKTRKTVLAKASSNLLDSNASGYNTTVEIFEGR
jgi:hypothetical protein